MDVASETLTQFNNKAIVKLKDNWDYWVDFKYPNMEQDEKDWLADNCRRLMVGLEGKEIVFIKCY